MRDVMISAMLADPGVVAVDMCRGTLQHKMHGITEVVPTVALRAESSPRVARAVRAAARLRGLARDEVRRRVPAGLLRRMRGLDRPAGAGSGGAPAAAGGGSGGAPAAEQGADGGAQAGH
jgi:hypothetical protein